MQHLLGVYLPEFQSPRFPWALIKAQGYLVEIGLRIVGQVGFFRKVLSQQAVGVFVGAALPGALRITEVDLHLRGHREAFVSGHLQASIPGQRTPQGLSHQASDNLLRLLLGRA